MAHAPVSVVVPMRDEAGTVTALLQGLARQEILPREIIFVDTGSADGSAERVRAWWTASGWDGTRCSVMAEPGAFPGGGRNAGVRASGQDWIAFIDCGIVPEPGWLKALLACAGEGAPGTLGLCRFEGEGTWPRAFCALSYGVGTQRPVLPASLFRRSLFDAAGLFDPALRAGEDLLWLQKVRAVHPALAECAGARVVYAHFPASLAAAAGKWFHYERSVSAAGIGGWGRRALFGGALLLYILPFASPVAGAALWLAYVALRGIVDPVRRSARRWWWRGLPLAPVAALPAALVMDTARALGSLAGIASHAPRA